MQKITSENSRKESGCARTSTSGLFTVSQFSKKKMHKTIGLKLSIRNTSAR